MRRNKTGHLIRIFFDRPCFCNVTAKSVHTHEQLLLTQNPHQKSTASEFFFKTKHLLLFLKSKYKSIPHLKIVREHLFFSNNPASLRSLMRILGLRFSLYILYGIFFQLLCNTTIILSDYLHFYMRNWLLVYVIFQDFFRLSVAKCI